MESFDESLEEIALALLAGDERHDLPQLTREEMLALGFASTHTADQAWAAALSDRERELIGAAGLRSLLMRELVGTDGDSLEPRHDLLVLACAVSGPSWTLLLGDDAEQRQLLLRGLPQTDACVIAAAAAGIHVHALATDAAGLREAASWLLDGPADSPRSVHVAGPRHPQGVRAQVVNGERPVLKVADGEHDIDHDGLVEWIGHAVGAPD